MSDITQIVGSSWALWGAAALALITAMIYLVIASPVVPEDYKAPPGPVMIVAGAAYLTGGSLILLADRRLLLLGLVLNPLVLAAYVAAAIKGKAAVDGLTLTGKGAQVALEVVLAWLVLQPTALTGEPG
jgi:hypothetical protein